LRVDECVHRIDDERRDSIARLRIADQVINDRQEIGEALARAGAARDDIAFLARRARERLGLMSPKPVRVIVRRAKDARGLGMQRAFCGKLVHCLSVGIGRADLQQEIRPEVTFLFEYMIDELPRALVRNVEERADEVAVILKNSGVEIEDGHRPCPTGNALRATMDCGIPGGGSRRET
jgi:hypothetical protein